MAALDIATVTVESSRQLVAGIAGVALTAGQSVRLDSANNNWVLAQADSAVNSGQGGVGIVSGGASQGSPAQVARTSTRLKLSFNSGQMLPGQLYCVGATAGQIVPISDLVATNFTTVLGFAETSDILVMQILMTLIAKQ